MIFLQLYPMHYLYSIGGPAFHPCWIQQQQQCSVVWLGSESQLLTRWHQIDIIAFHATGILSGIERFCIGCHRRRYASLLTPLNFPPSLFQTIKDVDLQALDSLEYINLSRNLIREIMPGTFLGMGNLKGLDFSVNVVRKVSCREKKGSTRYLQSSAPPPFLCRRNKFL